MKLVELYGRAHLPGVAGGVNPRIDGVERSRMPAWEGESIGELGGDGAALQISRRLARHGDDPRIGEDGGSRACQT
jgi:hypothetical protein